MIYVNIIILLYALITMTILLVGCEARVQCVVFYIERSVFCAAYLFCTLPHLCN